MKPQRIRGKRRRFRIFRRRLWKKAKRGLRKTIIKVLEAAIKLQVIVKETIRWIKEDREDVNILIAGLVTVLISGGMVALYMWMPTLEAYFG